MTITKPIIKLINSLIEKKAESYFEYEHLSWQDSIDHAKDDFGNNVKELMHDEGYELTDEECADLDIFAMNHVNWKTIRDNV